MLQDFSVRLRRDQFVSRVRIEWQYCVIMSRFLHLRYKPKKAAWTKTPYAKQKCSCNFLLS
jgi:hypothetical protein